MKKFRAFGCLVALAAAGALLVPTSASAADCLGTAKQWTLRAFYAKLDAAGDHHETASTDPVERSKLSINSGDGFGAEAEYRLNCPFGLSLGYIAADLDSMFTFDTEEVWLMDNDTVGFSMLSIGANFHLTPKSRMDLYIGPFIGIVDLDDATFDLGGPRGRVSESLDGETALGFTAGLDVPFKDNGPWAFTASLRYATMAADGNDGLNIDIDPLIATAGIAYRWGRDACCETVAPMVEPEPEPEPEPEVAPAPAPPPPPPAPAPAPPAPAPVEEREVCHFNSNGARVPNICKAKLDEVALKLKQDPALGALVVGHADSTGNDGINDPLSVRRAEAVKSYLVERHSIDANRVATEGRGSSEAAASNDSREGRAENRRAVVIISLG